MRRSVETSELLKVSDIKVLRSRLRGVKHISNFADFEYNIPCNVSNAVYDVYQNFIL